MITEFKAYPEKKHFVKRQFITSLIAIIICLNSYSQKSVRKDFSLNENWLTVANDTNQNAFDGFEQPDFNAEDWEKVDVPHNWDKYEGYRRLLHGNRHGYAWYRKEFTVDSNVQGRRLFLWFEGVGSYATVWLNGKEAGYHAGGRTSFTIDITEFVNKNNKPNLLAVRADHPSSIRDLPWVCGGCSGEWGFSEGSQPMGIFRPVHLITTGPVRIEPFGVHIWNDTTVSGSTALINIETEIKNYSENPRSVILVNRLLNQNNAIVLKVKERKEIPPGTIVIIRHDSLKIDRPHLWSPDDPYLYTLESEVIENSEVIDYTTTMYGIRWISWPVGRDTNSGRFFVNGKPVFLNGTAEYEHLMGQSHAFSAEQIQSRVMQIRAAGFNSFRDAHQPHNLRYDEYWDQYGILWWPQFAAHIWFDNPEFRNNFKNLLKDWIKERRNSPSVILWGLENESTLPTDFAEECTDIIRELDPTTSGQRKVTTCNGGTGTDWNVIQNWSGTYAGDPYAYAEDIQRELLNGEYGAWRSIELHTEGLFEKDGILSEDRMVQLMEMKIKLAESVRDKCCGQYHWPFISHDNPGRIQNGEGLRELDRIGPVNYKGLFTSWGEPADAYYMYRANYASKEKEPMVYIVSHTWPYRWVAPGIKDGIIVYSNCDEVELFNDVNALSLGRKKHGGIGTHFQWDAVDVKYNVLYAKGYIKGKPVAQDYIILNHLPESPNISDLKIEENPVTYPVPGYNYIYRINCGGPDYTDKNGNIWMADCHKTSDTTWGSKSWTDDFKGMPPFYGSQRRTFDPIKNTGDWKLFQTLRYGRDKLYFEFPVPEGDYFVELYFVESWYGIGGGMDCSGWRIFDVAINNKTVIKNLDIWKEAGCGKVLKKVVKAQVSGSKIIISFPRVTSGQAVISAIAVASANHEISPAPGSGSLINNLSVADKQASGEWSVRSWMDIGDKQYSDDVTTFRLLPSGFYGAEWIRTPKMIKRTKENVIAEFSVSTESDVFVAMDTLISERPVWLEKYVDTKTTLENDYSGGHKFRVYSKRFPEEAIVLLGNNGTSAAGNAEMYTVAVCPVTSLKQAGDLRPVIRYSMENAILSGSGISKNKLKGRQYAEFTRAGGDTIKWEISVGVGDTYSLRFRYMNSVGENIPMHLKILDYNGLLILDDQIDFSPADKKWSTLRTSTGTSINAGKYKIMLCAAGKKGLKIEALSVK